MIFYEDGLVCDTEKAELFYSTGRRKEYDILYGYMNDDDKQYYITTNDNFFIVTKRWFPNFNPFKDMTNLILNIFNANIPNTFRGPIIFCEVCSKNWMQQRLRDEPTDIQRNFSIRYLKEA